MGIKQKSKRLRVLSDTEVELLYQQPEFTSLERCHFFDLSDEERKYIGKLSIESAVYFIIAFGYFKAKHQFFKFNFKDVGNDVNFVIATYFPETECPNKIPSRNTISSLKAKVLSFFDFTNSSEQVHNYLEKKVGHLVRFHSDPCVIFMELLGYLEQNKMVLPAYSIMQDILGRQIGREEERLKKIISNFMTNDISSRIKKLIKDKNNLYKLSELKLDLKNFKYKQMILEINKQKETMELYTFAKQQLPKLWISEQNIKYYASLIFYYTPYKLRTMDEEIASLYVLCYIYYRHQKINDNITQAFLYLVTKYISEANEFSDKTISKEQKELDIDNKKIGLLLGYYTDESMFNMKFVKVAEKAYETMPKDQISKIKNHFTSIEDYREQLKWNYYADNHRAIAMNLRHLFLALDIQSDSKKNILLMEAIQFLKGALLQTKPLTNISTDKIPMKIVPAKAKNHLISDGLVVDPSKYEFFLYEKVLKGIKDHKIYLNNTLQFKSFEEDIKATRDWERDHEKILKKIDKPKLSGDINDRLIELEEELENSYVIVNQRIQSGQNKHIKIEEKDGKKSWTLLYPKEEDCYDHRYFKQLTPVSITDVFDFVNDICNFMSAFPHIKPRHSKSNVDYIYIKACIIANATRQGSYKMAKCSDLDFELLRNTEHNHIRLNTVMAACDIILKKIIAMPAFQQCGPDSDVYHCSIDGSKQGTIHQTSKARYSPKYFGLEKGVSILGMILNNASINGAVIGANEHESHYLYDLYHNMSVDVDIDILSTDTAGTNQVNFAIFDIADSVQFAPHYKSITERANKLYGFKSSSHYKDMLIKPEKKANKELIIDEWPKLQPILAALFMKETTQSIVVKKLCSHGSQSKTKKALWEYNNILFSIYMLRYIDDPILRRSVRIVLNRGEGYNKQYNAVAKVGGKKFRGLSELEMSIWHQCTRLVTLIIVFYNMYMLSRLITESLRNGDKKQAELIAHISPLATSHIILGGSYTYEGEKEAIDIEGLISLLGEIIDK